MIKVLIRRQPSLTIGSDTKLELDYDLFHHWIPNRQAERIIFDTIVKSNEEGVLGADIDGDTVELFIDDVPSGTFYFHILGKQFGYVPYRYHYDVIPTWEQYAFAVVASNRPNDYIMACNDVTDAHFFASVMNNRLKENPWKGMVRKYTLESGAVMSFNRIGHNLWSCGAGAWTGKIEDPDKQLVMTHDRGTITFAEYEDVTVQEEMPVDE